MKRVIYLLLVNGAYGDSPIEAFKSKDKAEKKALECNNKKGNFNHYFIEEIELL